MKLIDSTRADGQHFQRGHLLTKNPTQKIQDLTQLVLLDYYLKLMNEELSRYKDVRKGISLGSLLMLSCGPGHLQLLAH